MATCLCDLSAHWADPATGLIPERPASSPPVPLPTVNQAGPPVLPSEQIQTCSRCWSKGHSALSCQVPRYLVNEHKQLNQVWNKLEGALTKGLRRVGCLDQYSQSWRKEEQPQNAEFSEGSGGGAIHTASHTEAQSDPITTLQLKDRVWDLSCGPAAAQLREVAKIWTGPWILEERVASDLY